MPQVKSESSGFEKKESSEQNKISFELVSPYQKVSLEVVK